MFKTLYELFRLLDAKHRRMFYILLPAILFMGIMDVVGVAFIVPFMMVVANPAAIQTSSKIAFVYHALHFSNPETFLLFLGWIVFFALLLGNALTVLGNWLLIRFSGSCDDYFAMTLYEKYLKQPYSFYLAHNISELISHISVDVDKVLVSVMIPGLLAISKWFGILFIVILLLLVQPQLAIVLCIVMALSFLLVSRTTKRKLSAISQRNSVNRAAKAKILTESFLGIKEIKLRHKENVFLKCCSGFSKTISKDTAIISAFSIFPRYVLEVIAFGGMVLVVLYLLAHHYSSAHVIPILALYAFAGYRIMPGLQIAFSAYSSIRANRSSVDVLTQNWKQAQHLTDTPASIAARESIVFERDIELDRLSFSYRDAAHPLLEELNLKIPAKKAVAFVGATGSGKTTIVDLILGLLMPQSGCVKVDGQAINAKNIYSWQEKLGYVPQNIFLLDTTIIENIAFGVSLDHVDLKRVEEVAKIANIHDFVLTLENGYETIVGDRGVRLSGGQRQRIGIARALYHDPEVLVLDEATSALDGATEAAVMDAIHHLAHKKTIILIAHRLSTVRACDIIFFLEKGRVSFSGTYDALVAESEAFRKIANLV